MIAFLIVGVGAAVVGGIWLYQRAQGKEKRLPDQKLTDALQKLKAQGGAAARKYRDKDK